MDKVTAVICLLLFSSCAGNDLEGLQAERKAVMKKVRLLDEQRDTELKDKDPLKWDRYSADLRPDDTAFQAYIRGKEKEYEALLVTVDRKYALYSEPLLRQLDSLDAMIGQIKKQSR